MRKFIAQLDDMLHSITMYKLVLFGLSWLVAMAFLLTMLDILSFNPWQMLIGLVSLIVAAVATNLILQMVYKLPSNHESAFITALILFFIMGAPVSLAECIGLVLAAITAIASKFVLTWRGGVIVNPAAFGAFVVSSLGVGFAAWWIATPWMLPFTLILGLGVIHKLRRYDLFFVFLAIALVLLALRDIAPEVALKSWPLVFLGTIMLTEPATMPSGRRNQLLYAAVVAILLALPISVYSLGMTPQLALVVGNVVALLLVSRAAAVATFVSKRQLTPSTYEFTFQPEQPLKLQAGQYLDWTLDGIKLNIRGNRRNFTVSSSPVSKTLSIGVKINQPGSSFKKHLLQLGPGDRILAARPSGTFILPDNRDQKLAFIAGGIGVTPFIAMLRELIDTKGRRDIVLIYFAANESEVAYRDVLQAANMLGVKVVLMTDPAVRMDGAALQQTMPDYQERLFYLSGPPGMVRSYKALLRELVVRPKHIKTDYFSGY